MTDLEKISKRWEALSFAGSTVSVEGSRRERKQKTIYLGERIEGMQKEVTEFKNNLKQNNIEKELRDIRETLNKVENRMFINMIVFTALVILTLVTFFE